MRTGEEIADALEVDLHVRHLHEILEVGLGLDDRLEYLLCDSRDNTLELLRVNVCTLRRR
jgi:hypothetical protein